MQPMHGLYAQIALYNLPANPYSLPINNNQRKDCYMAHMRKVRPGNKLAQVLRTATGEYVSADYLRDMMENDPRLAPTVYKLSGYIGDIRKYDMGVVRVRKSGRTALAYSLTNWYEFDANGHRLTGAALEAALNMHMESLLDALSGESLSVPEVAAPDDVLLPEPAETAMVVEPAETILPETAAEDVILSPDYTSPEEPVATEDPGFPDIITKSPARDAHGHFIKRAA